MSSWDGKSNPSFQVTHPVSFCVAPLTFELNSDVFPFFPSENSQISNYSKTSLQIINP